MIITPEMLLQAKLTIESLLNITADEHSELLFEAGMLYMERTYGGDGDLYEFHAYSAVTWDWYSYQWHRANYEILLQLGFNPVKDSIKNEAERAALQDAFNEAHWGQRIIYPPKIILVCK